MNRLTRLMGYKSELDDSWESAADAHSQNLVAHNVLGQYGYKSEARLAADLDLLFEEVA